MSNDNFEIERKFLIKYPIDFNKANIVSKSAIEQIYLKDTQTRKNTRIRKRDFFDKKEYTITSKIRINDMKRIENEKCITEEEYDKLKQEADTRLNIINKIRYVIEYNGAFFEMDVFDFWENAAVLEIELEDEKSIVDFPPYIDIISELTNNRAFTNHAMAYKVPDITKLRFSPTL